MKIGFTGTRHGMSVEQSKAVIQYTLDNLPIEEAHMGDCIGADEQFYHICRISGTKTVGHPPVNNNKRAFCKYDIELPAKLYLDRNKDIVNSCDILIVAPFTSTEQVRSGTWSTYRYAMDIKKKIVLIFPSGNLVKY